VPDGEDSFSEQKFSLGGDYTEIWIEYYLYVPSNFFHRNSSGADNNKFFKIESSVPYESAVTCEFYPHADGTSGFRRFQISTYGVRGFTIANNDEEHLAARETVPNVIGPGNPIVPGQWTQMRFHARSASDRETKDGVIEWFANGALVQQLYWDLWAEHNDDSGVPGKPWYLTKGYLMGWANSGYTEETLFYIDDFKLYVADPGW
jgi:hypothetical protein